MRLALAVALWASTVAAAAEEKLTVQTSRQGDIREILVEFVVAAPRQRVWEVMTDFDRMADFLPNLKESRVVSRQGNRLQVKQSGVARYGWFRFNFSSVRDVELTPFTAISMQGREDHVKQFSSHSQLSEQDGQTRISYRAIWEPNGFLASFVGDETVREQVTMQFGALEKEMLRREAEAAKAEKN